MSQSEKGTLLIRSTSESVAACDQFLRELNLLDTSCRVRLNVRRLRIENPLIVSDFRCGGYQYPGKRVTPEDLLLDPSLTVLCDSATLSGELGESLEGVLKGSAPRAEISGTVTRAGDHTRPLADIVLCYEEETGVRAEHHVRIGSNRTTIVYLPQSSASASSAGPKPNVLAVRAKFIEKHTGRVLNGPEMRETEEEPQSRKGMRINVTEVNLSGTPLPEALRQLSQSCGGNGEACAPSLGLILLHDHAAEAADRTLSLNLADEDQWEQRLSPDPWEEDVPDVRLPNPWTEDVLDAPLSKVLESIRETVSPHLRAEDSAYLFSERSVPHAPPITACFHFRKVPHKDPRTELGTVFRHLGIPFPDEPDLWYDPPSERLVVRGNQDDLERVRRYFDHRVAEPDQLLIESMLLDIDNPQFFDGLRRCASLFTARILNYPERCKGVRLRRHSQVLANVGATSLVRSPGGVEDSSALSFEMTPISSKSSYEFDLSCLWESGAQQGQSTFRIWDGQTMAIRLDPSPGGSGQRVLAFRVSLLDSVGMYCRPHITGEEDEADLRWPDIPAAQVGKADELLGETVLEHFTLLDVPIEQAVEVLRTQISEACPAGARPGIYLQIVSNIPDIPPDSLDPSDPFASPPEPSPPN
ncbi:MAG: hypothetical protein KAI66_23475, partial [Lentisphaeria bacterium]|nr:hypothetical protein [Lentisphaeria bacterium]